MPKDPPQEWDTTDLSESGMVCHDLARQICADNNIGITYQSEKTLIIQFILNTKFN